MPDLESVRDRLIYALGGVPSSRHRASEGEALRARVEASALRRAAGELAIADLRDISRRIAYSRSEHPETRNKVAGLAEEVGEVSRALRDHGSGSQEVRDECLDVIAVAWRIAVEGDDGFPARDRAASA